MEGDAKINPNWHTPVSHPSNNNPSMVAGCDASKTYTLGNVACCVVGRGLEQAHGDGF
jgi:hypothetical protein